jgi:hypothetical protein
VARPSCSTTVDVDLLAHREAFLDGAAAGRLRMIR